MKYRKKPVVIEAWRWLFTPEQEKSPTWVDDALWKWPSIGGIAFEPNHSGGARICIATLDAVAIALPGDWICRGVKGELYPCKPDIFEQLHEAISDDKFEQDFWSTVARDPQGFVRTQEEWDKLAAYARRLKAESDRVWQFVAMGQEITPEAFRDLAGEEVAL